MKRRFAVAEDFATFEKMPEMPPVVLTIAGFDPSCGAGVTADIKTFAAHGCYGIGCITALTVQSTSGVSRVEPVSPGIVAETLAELAQDVEIRGVKIGMLGSAPVAESVAEFLEQERSAGVVLDPVLKSSFGTDLTDIAGFRAIRERLLRCATVITPNLQEASALTGLPVTSPEEMKKAAVRLHQLGAKNVVVTGGDLDQAIDLLSFSASEGRFEQELFISDRQRSNSTHGTGCAFSSAIACHLALGRGLPEAVLLAKTYVVAAMAKAHPLGRGRGPLHHLFRLQPLPSHAEVADPTPYTTAKTR